MALRFGLSSPKIVDTFSLHASVSQIVFLSIDIYLISPIKFEQSVHSFGEHYHAVGYKTRPYILMFSVGWGFIPHLLYQDGAGFSVSTDS